jgi:hypothetical protein
MRTIRASEIGSFLYCRRAWGYQLKGVPSENRAEMAEGSELHRAHGRQVVAVGLQRAVGFVLLLAAVMLVTFYLVNLWL